MARGDDRRVKMIFEMKRRLGVGTAPTVGVQITESGAYLALVRSQPITVVGLGHVPVPIGTVVDGQVRRPAEAGSAIEDALATVHWADQPSLRVAVQPEPWRRDSGGTGGASTEPGLVTAVVREIARPASDRGRNATDHRPSHSDVELGMVAAAAQTVTSVAATMDWVTGAVRSIEAAPVSVARFLRVARPRQPLRFARLSNRQARWMLCDGDGRFEVEVVDQPGGLVALVDGPDQSRLTPTQWGRIPVERVVRSKVVQPHLFAPAVGAAIGEHVTGLTGDLLGPGSAGGARTEPFGRWTVEHVQ